MAEEPDPKSEAMQRLKAEGLTRKNFQGLMNALYPRLKPAYFRDDVRARTWLLVNLTRSVVDHKAIGSTPDETLFKLVSRELKKAESEEDVEAILKTPLRELMPEEEVREELLKGVPNPLAEKKIKMEYLKLALRYGLGKDPYYLKLAEEVGKRN